MNYPPVIIVQLVHIYGPMKGKIDEFSEGAISIGRNPGSSLCFPLELTVLSRRHAEIIRDGNLFKLADYSNNGTFVNGKRIKEVILKDGDVIEFSDGGPKVSFLTRFTNTPVTNKIKEDVIETGVKSVVQKESDFASKNHDDKKQLAHSSLQYSGSNNNNFQESKKNAELSLKKVSVPLVIQYGPAIRSFRELPIIVGKNPKSDFVISLPSMLDQHMQILFSQGQYWIKDITGKNQIKINDNKIDFQAALNLNDIITVNDK